MRKFAAKDAIYLTSTVVFDLIGKLGVSIFYIFCYVGAGISTIVLMLLPRIVAIYYGDFKWNLLYLLMIPGFIKIVKAAAYDIRKNKYHDSITKSGTVQSPFPRVSGNTSSDRS